MGSGLAIVRKLWRSGAWVIVAVLATQLIGLSLQTPFLPSLLADDFASRALGRPVECEAVAAGLGRLGRNGGRAGGAARVGGGSASATRPPIALVMGTWELSLLPIRALGRAWHRPGLEVDASAPPSAAEACERAGGQVVSWTAKTSLASAVLAGPLFGPLCGSLSDRVGRKPFVVLGTAALSVPYGLAALHVLLPDGSRLIDLRFTIVTQVLSSAFSLVLSSTLFLSDVLDPSHKAMGMGLVLSVLCAGFVIGPMLGEAIGIPRAFLVSLVFILASNVIAVIFLRESLPSPSRGTEGLEAGAGGDGAGAGTAVALEVATEERSGAHGLTGPTAGSVPGPDEPPRPAVGGPCHAPEPDSPTAPATLGPGSTSSHSVRPSPAPAPVWSLDLGLQVTPGTASDAIPDLGPDPGPESESPSPAHRQSSLARLWSISRLPSTRVLTLPSLLQVAPRARSVRRFLWGTSDSGGGGNGGGGASPSAGSLPSRPYFLTRRFLCIAVTAAASNACSQGSFDVGPQYYRTYLAYGPDELATLMELSGMAMLIVQAGVLPTCLRTLKARRTLTLGLAGVLAAQAMLTLCRSRAAILTATVLNALGSMVTPVGFALNAAGRGASEQGSAQGALWAVASTAQGFGTILYAWLFQTYGADRRPGTDFFPQAPFALGATLSAIAVFSALMIPPVPSGVPEPEPAVDDAGELTASPRGLAGDALGSGLEEPLLAERAS